MWGRVLFNFPLSFQIFFSLFFIRLSHFPQFFCFSTLSSELFFCQILIIPKTHQPLMYEESIICQTITSETKYLMCFQRKLYGDAKKLLSNMKLFPSNLQVLLYYEYDIDIYFHDCTKTSLFFFSLFLIVEGLLWRPMFATIHVIVILVPG